MKLSIVTISYNQAQFLEEAIKSVTKQQVVDMEYIIVDPGSVDGSREIINRYSDHFSHIIFEKDDGPADGLNKGFSVATGDWYGYLNSDDLYLDGGLERAFNGVAKFPNSGAIIGNGYKVNKDGRVIGRSISRKFSLDEALNGACFSLQQSTLYKAEAFHAVGGFNTKNRTSWDGELLIDMANAGWQIERIYQDVGVFRLHGDSITGSARLFNQYLDDTDAIYTRIRGRSKRPWEKTILPPLMRTINSLRDPRRCLDMARARFSSRLT